MPEHKKSERFTFFSKQWVGVRMPSCQNQIETAFEEIIHKVWGRSVWRPVVDVFETPDDFVIKVDLPGVDPDNISITAVNEYCLSINGERREEEGEDVGRVLVRERPAGQFSRLISFGFPLDMLKTRQQFVEGVLILTIPKSKEE